MATRWMLSRAGIINVYQYGNETFSFAGGRLLLRGVNGSGKSTAMNMLLPFLLESDPRRIDAAGTQTGVIQSWMLNGSDQPQPQGYLWIQFTKGDRHLACGCGIRANRKTGKVKQWWFITDQQPGIDVSLVEDRHALSIEPLRAALEPTGTVYTQDQRSAYRAEVRNRLYGGADLDQHFRLLHTVRSPRVGDQIDHDLPAYLTAALPQLSEQALDNAAQPLEELEEHRRNVEALTRTADGLEAMSATYRSYARSELRRRSAAAHELVRICAKLERQERRSAKLAQEADEERLASYADLEALTQAVRRHSEEIASLKASPAYLSGAELNDLRSHVASLQKDVTKAEERVETAAQRVRQATERVDRAAKEHRDQAGHLHSRIDELGGVIQRLHLSAIAPSIPAVQPESIGSDPSVTVPRARPDLGPFTTGLGQIRAAARHRAGEVTEVRSAVDATAACEQQLREAERVLATFEAAAADERARLADAETALVDAVGAWQADLATWTDLLDDLQRAVGAPWEAPVIDDARIADAASHHVEIQQQWTASLDAIHQLLQRRLAEATTRRDQNRRTLAELDEEAAELAARSFPSPPSQAWQRNERPIVLAEVIDFHPSIEPEQRIGIEAALAASGLLGAELTSAGLAASDGQLHLTRAPAVRRSLASLLEADLPSDAPAFVTVDLVESVLRSISIDPADLEQPETATVITTDGRFRLGIASGRHSVDVAEHIGTSSRRAALERQRAELAARITAEKALRDQAKADEGAATAALGLLESRRSAFPSAGSIQLAQASRQAASAAVERASVATETQQAITRDAEAVYADATDRAQLLASTYRLPLSALELVSLDQDLRTTGDRCGTIEEAARAAADAVSRWIEHGKDWSDAVETHRAANADLGEAMNEHLQHQSRLITLEDSVGLPYQEVLASIARSQADLDEVEPQIGPATQRTRAADEAIGTTKAELAAAVVAREQGADTCIRFLPTLRATIAVRGLLDAATEGIPIDENDDQTVLAVPDSPDGLRMLAEAIDRRVPEPTGAPVTAEGVRSSIRQRREALGAGWDAIDAQPDEALPIVVEVNGPLTRAPLAEAARTIRVQLHELSSLLTAQQDQALRNLLQGMVGREVAEKLHAARTLVDAMNQQLGRIATSHGIGVRLRWHRRDDLDEGLSSTVDLLAKLPELRSRDEDRELAAALGLRIADARREDPEVPYRQLIATVLDYRAWHRMDLLLSRPGRSEERLSKRTVLSEGEKKMVTYLPLFAAAAASHDSLAERAPDAPRFVLLDDAFAKVSEDNHPKLFGLLVELKLDFIATSERLWGTHASVPELAITEVVRDAALRTIVLEHFRWNGRTRSPG